MVFRPPFSKRRQVWEGGLPRKAGLRFPKDRGNGERRFRLAQTKTSANTLLGCGAGLLCFFRWACPVDYLLLSPARLPFVSRGGFAPLF